MIKILLFTGLYVFFFMAYWFIKFNYENFILKFHIDISEIFGSLIVSFILSGIIYLFING